MRRAAPRSAGGGRHGLRCAPSPAGARAPVDPRFPRARARPGGAPGLDVPVGVARVRGGGGPAARRRGARRREAAPAGRGDAQPVRGARGPSPDGGDRARRARAAGARARERRRPDDAARRQGAPAGCAGPRVLEPARQAGHPRREQSRRAAGRPPVRALGLPRRQAVNAGVFDVDASGRALFESTDFPRPDAQNFAVTIEPRGGLPAPSGPIVLVGSPA